MKIPTKNVIPLFVVLAILALTVGYLIKNTDIFQGGSACNATISNCNVVITSVAVSNISSSGATVTWETPNVLSDSAVKVFGGVINMTTPINTTPVISHSVNITGLAPSTAYFIRPLSSGVQAPSSLSFTTLAGNPPSVTISAVTSSNITQTGANISWTTNIGSNSRVEYGTTQSYGSMTTLDPASVTSHNVILSGLTANTIYYYRVLSGGAIGTGQTFTTLAGVTDTTKPTISITSPASNATLSGTVTISANASDNVGVTQVEFYNGVNLLGTDTTSPYSVSWDTITIPNGATTIKAKAYDMAGNTTSTGNRNVNISNVIPTPVPVISNINEVNVSQSGATITWTTDIPSTTQVEYGTTASYGSTTTLNSALVTSHGANITGLTAGTIYHYRVKSGNINGMSVSEDGTFTTLAGVIMVITNVTASNISSSSATVTWTTNDLANSQVEYGTTASYGSTTTLNTTPVITHSVVLTGLLPNTMYHYMAKSGSVTSLDFTFTTLANGVIPTVTASTFTNPGPTNSTITVKWTTNIPSDSQVVYGTTQNYTHTTALDTTQTTNHSVTLTGLKSQTEYNFRFKSSGYTSYNYKINTTAMVAGGNPNIRNIGVNNITGTSATITWETSRPTNSQVKYGTNTTFGLSTTLDPALTTNHSVVLSGLSLNTNYIFYVVSDTVTSPNSNFITTTGTPPVSSAITAINITQDSATINWITDQLADSQIIYGTTMAYGKSTAVNTPQSASHSIVLSGLNPNTTYHYKVKSGGVLSSNKTFTTSSYSLKFGFTIGKMENVFIIDAYGNVSIRPAAQKALDQIKLDGFKDINIINPFTQNYLTYPANFPDQSVKSIKLLTDQGFRVLFSTGVPFIDGSGSTDSWMFNYFPGDDPIGTDDNGGLPEYTIRMKKFMDGLKKENILQYTQFAIGSEPNSGVSSSYMPLAKYQELTAELISILQRPEYAITEGNINCCSWTHKLMTNQWDPVTQASWWNFASTQMSNPMLQNFGFSYNWYPYTGISPSAIKNTTADIAMSPMPQGSRITELNVSTSLTLKKILGGDGLLGFRAQETLKQVLDDVIPYATTRQFKGIYMFSLVNNTDIPDVSGGVSFGFFRAGDVQGNVGCPSWEYKVLLERLNKPINFGSCSMPVITVY